MKSIYIITGAIGHLGNTLVRMLKDRGETVRGLILPTESAEDCANVQYIHGDVCDKDSMEPLFADTAGKDVYFIHTAGIVDISGDINDRLYKVNVLGTKNVAEICLEHHVKRLVYVSSVHAIPEKENMGVMQEVNHFSDDAVVGGYAKTKALASQLVLDATSKGLNAVIVHPSGILGPYDLSGGHGNHMVQLVYDYISGKLPACVKGGYDFVDVRDVAIGCLEAAERGRPGECYILSNRHYEVKDLLKMLKSICGGRRLPVLPMWMAKAAAPLLGWIAKLKKERPLYTKYSLYTLKSNDKFSHDKATSELGYKPRDLYQTLKDTVAWLKRKPQKA